MRYHSGHLHFLPIISVRVASGHSQLDRPLVQVAMRRTGYREEMRNEMERAGSQYDILFSIHFQRPLF